ncbi:Thioredoxin-like protein 1 [Hondaea fermentalgiana]|uniref:Thioredoxin-like protein 1 n=1 Tax=Hondaea fermentalgiana TaxID=2315210 RepID=A0A2R5GDD8_9STRA|nr:Thioredoxin-like protein 1 [Hondaea fermentalgiana]|eukprot:GBG28972.1 Thioredoxin-like protein 1 [Hondaea fermentalgiana]
MSSQQVDLSSYVSKADSYALNVDSAFPMENLYNSDERSELRSDADDQLIVHFAFTEKVKLTGLNVVAPRNERRPEHIKLFTNQVSVGFEDIESLPAAFEMDVEGDDVTEGKMIPLRMVKFNNIDSVTLFVESSEGGDIAALSSVKFFGQAIQGTNMSELKKTPGA